MQKLALSKMEKHYIAHLYHLGHLLLITFPLLGTNGELVLIIKKENGEVRKRKSGIILHSIY